MRYKEKYNWLLLLSVAICCFACTAEREPTDGYTLAGTRAEVPMSVHLGVQGAATDPEQINTSEAAIRRLRLYVFDGNVLDKMYYWDNINTVETYTTPTFMVKAGTGKSVYVIVNEPEDADTRAQLEAVTHPVHLPEIKYSLSAMGLEGNVLSNDGTYRYNYLPMYGERGGADALPSSTATSPQRLEISVDRAVARVDVYVRKDYKDYANGVTDDFVLEFIRTSDHLDTGFISSHSLLEANEESQGYGDKYYGESIQETEKRMYSFYVPELDCRDKKVKITLEFVINEYTGEGGIRKKVTVELGGGDDTSSPLEKIERNHVYKLHCSLTKLARWENTLEIDDWEYNHLQAVEVTQDVRVTNCYVVRPGETIDIPLKNIYAAWAWARELGGGIPKGRHIDVTYVWQDVPFQTVADKAIMGGGKDRTTDYIRVKGINEGNAVIALTVDDVIYWSWHIWVTDYDPNKLDGWKSVNGRIWMDRNLGAMSGEYTPDGAARGLIYQWGRKDPFPGTKGFGDNTPKPVYVYDAGGSPEKYIEYISKQTDGINLMYSLQHPDQIIYALDESEESDWYTTNTQEYANNQLWSADKKTIFDPCPAGWRVPDNEAFDRDGDGVTDLIYNYDNSVWGMFSTNKRIYFPYTPRYRSGAFFQENQDYNIMNLWGCASRTHPGEIAGCFESVSLVPGGNISLSHSRHKADALPVRCIKEK